MSPNPTPPVSCRYGAPMGRIGSRRGDAEAPDTGALYLRRVPLDSGGYDRGGAYWGLGAPLYWCGDESGDISLYFRARSRDAAKAHVREDLGDGARFKR